MLLEVLDTEVQGTCASRIECQDMLIRAAIVSSATRTLCYYAIFASINLNATVSRSRCWAVNKLPFEHVIFARSKYGLSGLLGSRCEQHHSLDFAEVDIFYHNVET